LCERGEDGSPLDNIFDGRHPPFPTSSFQVRDSELDQYNVVNNAVYAVYFQHVRHKFLAHVGLPADAAAADGGALALAEQTIRFRAPLRSGDVFRGGLGVRPGGGGARVVIDQYLERADGARVADGVATVVSLDASYRPRRVPVTVRAALESGEAVGEGEGWV
jgi:acyl-CoA thioesterase FadM